VYINLGKRLHVILRQVFPNVHFRQGKTVLSKAVIVPDTFVHSAIEKKVSRDHARNRKPLFTIRY